jgi:hypothetical protein
MPTNNAAAKVGITKILAESYVRSSIIIADNSIPQTKRANTDGLNEYFEEVLKTIRKSFWIIICF